MPDEPHIQGGIMKRAIGLEQSRQIRNPAMEPTKLKLSENSQAEE